MSAAATPQRTWDAIWADYLGTSPGQRPTFTALAAEHGVSARAIARHARLHRWAARAREMWVREQIRNCEGWYPKVLADARRTLRLLEPMVAANDVAGVAVASRAARDALSNLDFVAAFMHRMQTELAKREGRSPPARGRLRVAWPVPPWYTPEQRRKARAERVALRVA